MSRDALFAPTTIMKILRNLGIALALFLPALAAAGPKQSILCCDEGCCPGCPFCPSGLHR